MKRNKVWFAIVLIVPFLLFTGVVLKSDIYLEISKNIEIFNKVYKEVTFNYVDEVNPGEFLRAGIRGMLGTLDPYTVFIDEKKQDDIDYLTTGKYGGIGVSIGFRDGNAVIIDILSGYSAERQGMRIGDAILSVNGVVIDEEKYQDISSYIKGEPGTTVTLRSKRSGVTDTLTFVLVREEVSVKNVLYSGFVDEKEGVGYIKLVSFSKGAADEVETALKDLQETGKLRSLILDLRDNPGGLLEAAVAICEKFLAKGSLVVSTRGRDNGSLREYYSKQEPMAGDLPLVVLIDGGSASASEIVAGAIQDHDRGVLIGEQSFGKGLVQTVLPIAYNTSLKITTSRYYTPSGRSIQKVDYFKGNKSLKSKDSVFTSSFQTDNKRTVYSGGGVAPDSLVTPTVLPDPVSDMLAKGLFFDFSSLYFNENPDVKIASIDDQQLLKQFEKFLKTKSYEYKSTVAKQVDSLYNAVKAKKEYAALLGKIAEVKGELNSEKINYTATYKTEILSIIKTELSSRKGGNSMRIVGSFAIDPQVTAAVLLLKSPERYNSLLKR